jgi:hypothetical protein
MSFPKAPFQSIIADSTSKVFGVWQQWFDRTQAVLNAVTSSGRTIDRPTGNLYVGQQFFDTDLNQEVFWNGTTWTTSGNGSVTVGTTTTGAPGTNAAVVNSGTPTSAVLDFTIPRGDTGAIGPTGDTGDTGSAATVNVGTTITGAAGSNAAVNNSGTSSAAVLNFIIPRGNTGATGPQGPAGPVSYAAYGSFYDTTNQAAATTTTAYSINIGSQFEAIDVFIANDLSSNPTQITFNVAGVYNIQFSLQFTNTATGGANYNTDVWFRLNGIDIDYSNSIYWIPQKNGSTNGDLIAVCNLVTSLNSGDYVQLMWSPNTTAISIATFAAGTTPTVPVTPGVILTACQVR